MSKPKFEPVTEAELAQLRDPRYFKSYAKYEAFALHLMPRVAEHLAALMFAGKAVERAWDADEIGGVPLADLFALCGNVPDGMTLVSTTELSQMVSELRKHGFERICYDCDEPAVDDRACARHSDYAVKP